MNHTRYKIALGWLAFVFIVLHFTFILAYALPTDFSSPTLKKMATPYVEPIFTQHWSMFAPCPTINSKVEIKVFFSESDSTDWFCPTAEARKKHSWYRGSYHGELVLAESNLVYWLGLDMNDMGIRPGEEFPLDRTGEFQKGYSFFKIKDYIRGNARYLYDKPIKKGQIRCYLEDVTTSENGVLTLPEYTYE